MIILVLSKSYKPASVSNLLTHTHYSQRSPCPMHTVCRWKLSFTHEHTHRPSHSDSDRSGAKLFTDPLQAPVLRRPVVGVPCWPSVTHVRWLPNVVGISTTISSSPKQYKQSGCLKLQLNSSCYNAAMDSIPTTTFLTNVEAVAKSRAVPTEGPPLRNLDTWSDVKSAPTEEVAQ